MSAKPTLEEVNAAADEHRKYFNILCEGNPALKADWKGPIKDKFATERLARKMERAVQFMTGAPVTLTKTGPAEWTLESIGYRAGPCGDH